MLNLEEIIQLIRKHLPEYDRNDIMKMVNEKREELGKEVVNEDSAAMIVARELGIDLNQVTVQPRQRIEDITENSRQVLITAKVIHIGTVRTFARKDGGEGKVASITIADETGQIRVALWDEMTRIVSDEAISIGDVIQIRGAYVRKGLRNNLELNLGRSGGIKIFEKHEIEDLDIKIGEPKTNSIADLERDMFDVALTVRVLRKFRLSTFKRKTDGSQGKVLSMVVGDDTGTIRLVFWDEHADMAEAIQEGEVIRVSGLRTREGRNEGEIEAHLTRSSQVERNLDVELEVTETAVIPESDPVGRLKISDMKLGLRDVDLEAKVIEIYPPREFEHQGERGQVQNILVADESKRTIRVAFWHEDIEKIRDLKVGDVIRIQHGYVKKGFRDDIEYGVGDRAEVEINPKDSAIASLDIQAITPEEMTTESHGRVRIEEMKSGMWDVDIEGKVLRMFPPNQFERKDGGGTGLVQNVIIVDESGKSIRAAFWNEDVEKLEEVKEGDIIRVRHGYIKKGIKDSIEFGVGRNAEIEINPKDSIVSDLDIEGQRFVPVVIGQRTLIEDIGENSEGDIVEVCGIIVAVGQNSPVYPACPECLKKVEFVEDDFVCKEHGKVEPEYRMLYKITIDDGSGTIRATLFGKTGEDLLGMSAVEAQKLIEKSKNDRAPFDRGADRILGNYVVVKGRVSKYRDSYDITASDLSYADPLDEIARMKERVESQLN